MLKLDDIQTLDDQWSEFLLMIRKSILSRNCRHFYNNPICFAGIFTGNDFSNSMKLVFKRLQS